MHAISSYRGNKPTNRQDRLQYTHAAASAQCNYVMHNINVGKHSFCDR